LFNNFSLKQNSEKINLWAVKNNSFKSYKKILKYIKNN